VLARHSATVRLYAVTLTPVPSMEAASEHTNPDAESWNRRGLTLCGMRRFDQAVQDFDRAIAINPGFAEAHCNKGKALATLGRAAEALPVFDRAIAIEPDFADAWYCRGNACNELKRYEDARSAFETALRLRPDMAEAWLGHGNASYRLDLKSEAIASYDKALAFIPRYAEALNNRATVLLDLKKFGDAIAGFEKALQAKADFADAWLGLGASFYELPDFDKAIAAFDKALSLNPNLVKAWVGRANALAHLKDFESALVAFDKALELNPFYAEVHAGRAEVLLGLRRLAEAVAACDRALALNENLAYTSGTRLNLKLLICDWSNFHDEIAELIEITKAQASPNWRGEIGSGKIAQPMVLARLVDDRAVLLSSAINWTYVYGSHPKPFIHARRERSGKIRLGYLSQDFYQHVTGRGFVELFEKHDTSRFELHGISLSRDDNGVLRKRIEAAFDKFVDVCSLSDEAAAHLIRDLGIDVLVEMVPHSLGSRTAILAHRPAPVQVNGWAAGYSSGSGYLDYVLGDPWMLPVSDQPFFSEKIVRLPHTCFPYDTTQIIGREPKRSEVGLPKDSFVFCSFNASYKITPKFFAVWMRLLQRIEGSVLWLARNNAYAVQNLRRAAKAAGVDPDRLVFAEVKPAIEDHLARHRLADLSLDTLPYNAHTTAMDSLWAGVPIVSCIGRSFAGRFAQSQLHGIGMPELIASDIAAYEELAVNLARDPVRLNRIKAAIANNRAIMPLFDTQRLCRELESAYATMLDIWLRGESPRSFDVGPI
jgi:protein O-GlcNAc transferase